MRKILIIGASFLQVPAIRKAKEKGYWVAVADYNPKAIGIADADEYFNVSTIDHEGLLKVAKLIKPDGIMTMATDMPIRAISYVTSKLGLVGHSSDIAYAATDKIAMINRFKTNYVESPWFFTAETFNEFISKVTSFSLPIIVKPADNSGSRGVIMVRKSELLQDAFWYSKACSRSGSVIVEQYIEGDEVSVELFVVNCEPIVLAITDKTTTNEPNFIEVAHSQPTRFTGNIRSQIELLAIRAAKAIGITHGPVHAEMRITSEGPVMIELGARLGGDCISSHLVPLSTGIDMVGATIDCVCNEPINLTRRKEYCSAINFFYPKDIGKVIEVRGIETVKHDPRIVEIFVSQELPFNFTGLHNSSDRVGHIVAQADTPEEIESVFSEAKKAISFVYG